LDTIQQQILICQLLWPSTIKRNEEWDLIIQDIHKEQHQMGDSTLQDVTKNQTPQQANGMQEQAQPSNTPTQEANLPPSHPKQRVMVPPGK
jgi:hypothetical protein